MGTTVKALKDIYDDKGVTKTGEQTEMSEEGAKFHEKRGNVEIVKTKERKIVIQND